MLAHLWIGNGFTQEKAFSTYDEKRAELLTVDDAAEPAVPRTRSRAQTVGSRRRASTASAEEAFGEAGNPQLGIGNKDTRPGHRRPGRRASLDEPPRATERRRPAWMPADRREGRRRRPGSTSTASPEPTDELRKADR